MEQEEKKEGKGSRREEMLPPSPSTAQHFHHAKTSSMTGSVDSEAPSDSTLSFPSSDSRRKLRDGSEADSERDSVSPQRGHDEVSLMEDEKDDDNETTVSGVSLAWDTIIGQSTAKVPHGVP